MVKVSYPKKARVISTGDIVAIQGVSMDLQSFHCFTGKMLGIFHAEMEWHDGGNLEEVDEKTPLSKNELYKIRS